MTMGISVGKIIFAMTLALSINLNPSFARGGGGKGPSEKIEPGKSVPLQWWCQGYETGFFTWRFTVQSKSAGHEHTNGQRPYGKTSVNSVTIPCDYKWHRAGTYTAPKVSGRITMHIVLNGRAANNNYTFLVGVPGMARLSPSRYIEEVGTSYSRGRTPCRGYTHHDESHWGRPDLNAKIVELAAAYYKERKKKLEVNDMSLRHGGVFDVCDTWVADRDNPHQTHQDGHDVDIRWRLPAMNNNDRVAFRRLAEKVFGGRRHVCVHGLQSSNTHWHLSYGNTCSDTP